VQDKRKIGGLQLPAHTKSKEQEKLTLAGPGLLDRRLNVSSSTANVEVSIYVWILYRCVIQASKD
jgi:hypothetical protein